MLGRAKVFARLVIWGAVIIAAISASASMIGSKHDFTSSGHSQIALFQSSGSGDTNSEQQVCQVCHIPHAASASSAVNAPLWNHLAMTNAATRYTLYDKAGSATFNALNLGTMTTLGSSAACLSCHDGSIGVNQNYGTTSFNSDGTMTNVFVPSWAVRTYNGSTDLTHMHPLGVNYDAAVAASGNLKPVSSSAILGQMIKGTAGSRTVECTSCHDIHRTIGASGVSACDLIVDVEGGALCLTCHIR